MSKIIESMFKAIFLSFSIVVVVTWLLSSFVPIMFILTIEIIATIIFCTIIIVKAIENNSKNTYENPNEEKVLKDADEF